MCSLVARGWEQRPCWAAHSLDCPFLPFVSPEWSRRVSRWSAGCPGPSALSYPGDPSPAETPRPSQHSPITACCPTPSHEQASVQSPVLINSPQTSVTKLTRPQTKKINFKIGEGGRGTTYKRQGVKSNSLNLFNILIGHQDPVCRLCSKSYRKS